jgi:endonuclease/exonuclease/phosphatase (EEP) superfamily protein YafD
LQLIGNPSDSSEEPRIRLVTWNCCRGAYEAKAARLDALRPDVAVLQECARPDPPNASVAWFGANLRQGVAVISRPPYRVLPEPVREGSQSMFAARVLGPVSFTVVAVWAQREPTYSEALRRGLEVYRDLLAAGPTVLLGDFNSSAAWDNQHGRSDHRELEVHLKREFGLVSAYHAATGEQPGSESRPTHFWRWQEASPFHLDYCYLPEAWLSRLRDVTVGSYRDWADASDHRPVLVDVSPPPAIARAAV